MLHDCLVFKSKNCLRAFCSRIKSQQLNQLQELKMLRDKVYASIFHYTELLTQSKDMLESTGYQNQVHFARSYYWIMFPTRKHDRQLNIHNLSVSPHGNLI